MKLKKGAKRFLILISVILLLLIVFFGYQLFIKKGETKTKKEKITQEIKEYGYVLKEDDSATYKKMFQKLKKILEEDQVDEEAYVKQISQMFVSDFFTLSDKEAKTDVGGKMFVHQEALTNFLDKAEDTIYKYVENNLYGKRKQTLPTVQKVKIEKLEKIEFAYLDTMDPDAYQVRVQWEYQEDLDYQEEATLIFVHDENKLSLVEMEEDI